MTRLRASWRSLLAVLLVWPAALGIGRAQAARIEVTPDQSLQAALDRAAPGDTLHLAEGTHRGDIVIATERVTLEGDPGAVILGSGKGKVVWIKAPDVTIRGLTVRGSGKSLIAMDSGIYLEKTAHRGVIEDNDIEDNLISVYVRGPNDVLVQNNRIVGKQDLRRTERGSAVNLWNTPGTRIIGNDIRAGRDGIFSVTSRGNLIQDNVFHELRFAVHFMYTNHSEVRGNSSFGNDVGYVMMYSDHLKLEDNLSDGAKDHGLLFNYANSSEIVGNVARGSEKCVFIYNANKNSFRNNWFENCEIGVHFTAGSERNEITQNSFVASANQVKYVGTRLLDWAVDGQGNYWSDNPTFDLNGDGLGDTVYRPNDVIDQVVWRAPAAKLLMNSPAVQVVRWAQAQFPAIHPGGVFDSAPLMTPPRPPALARLETAP
ncbi:nitrous oxide reductase family maturation protein NosD [Geminicoccus harenae]|uniref:nitrous oxide reductase family maturation protein NosD n=1 Tax=Geminicoccus harenae TaxID=2498453 RepID=UPI00168AC4FB|nr:nitrous oxide reductase family maturation protein NosD [Geminicoccus harenae]